MEDITLIITHKNGQEWAKKINQESAQKLEEMIQDIFKNEGMKGYINVRGLYMSAEVVRECVFEFLV